MSARPELSVLIPVVNTVSDAFDALAALDKERETVDLEAIVLNRLGPSAGREIEAHYPWIRRIEVDAHATIPRMRQLGIDAATGDAVGVIEDHVIVPEGWARRMLDQLAAGHDVVGGSIDNAAVDTLLDWACFLTEYSHCIPPIPAGKVEWVPGNNVVYRRAVLEAHKHVLDPEKWEDHLHDALKAAGIELYCEPGIVVGHKKYYTLLEYLTQRYYYARSYAGARVRDSSPVRKLAFGAASFALPPLLMTRTLRTLFGKKKHLDKLVPSIPLIALFILSWSYGEVLGSWFGAGDSLEKVC